MKKKLNEIPEELFKKIEASAKKNVRSVNKEIHDSMGIINPTKYTLETKWDLKIKETFFIKEAGNMYFSFKPIKI